MNEDKHFAEAKRLVAFSPFSHLRRGPGVRQEIKQTKSSFLFLAIIPVGKVRQAWKGERVCSLSRREWDSKKQMTRFTLLMLENSGFCKS